MTLDVGHWTLDSLLRPLILRHVLIDVFQLVIAILDDDHHVVLVDHLWLVQDRRNILLAVVDGVFRFNLFLVGEFSRGIDGTEGQRPNWLVDGHCLFAFNYSLYGVERSVLSGYQD